MRLATDRGAARYLVGRRIVGVKLRPFDAGKARGRAFDPMIELDDGSCLYFVTVETDVGEYGVDIVRRAPSR